MDIFPFDELPGIIRKLAKQPYWQSVFSLAKESIGGTQILQNTRDFTYYQMMFINDLSFYSSLYYDIAMGEVSDSVLDNVIYEDAWYYYRTEKRLGKTKRRGTFMDSQHGTTIKKISDSKEEITNKNLWNFTKVRKT